MRTGWNPVQCVKLKMHFKKIHNLLSWIWNKFNSYGRVKFKNSGCVWNWVGCLILSMNLKYDVNRSFPVLAQYHSQRHFVLGLLHDFKTVKNLFKPPPAAARGLVWKRDVKRNKIFSFSRLNGKTPLVNIKGFLMSWKSIQTQRGCPKTYNIQLSWRIWPCSTAYAKGYSRDGLLLQAGLVAPVVAAMSSIYFSLGTQPHLV